MGTDPGVRRQSRPQDPIMGSCVESFEGSGEYAFTSGGMPDCTWSGLDKTAISQLSRTPFQMRPMSITGRNKSYKTLVNPLPIKFKATHNLSHFRKDVTRHLEAHGLDTIAYLPHPTDSSKVANVVDHYPIYVGNLKRALELAKSFYTKYDWMDHYNTCAAKEFLLSSLESTLRRRVELHLSSTDTFASAFLQTMHLITSFGPTHYDKLRATVRNTDPTKFEGENIALMAEEVGVTIGELECANMYEPALTQSMLSSINNKCTATGLFQYELLSKLKAVSQKVLICNHMSRHDANLEMEKEGLDPDTVLKELTQTYQGQKNEGMWEPASRKVDRSKPGQLSMVTGSPDVPENLVNLIQSSVAQAMGSAKKGGRGGQRDKSNDICHLCNEKGHHSHECPNKGKVKGKGAVGRQKVNQGPGMWAWKRTAPKKGEPETKMFKRKQYYWCGLCKQWRLNHSTATHGKVPQRENAQAAAHMAANFDFGFDSEPSAWVVMSDGPVESAWTWGCVIAWLMAMVSVVVGFRVLELVEGLCVAGFVQSVLHLLVSTELIMLPTMRDMKLGMDAIGTLLGSMVGQLSGASVAVSLAPLFWLGLLYIVSRKPERIWKGLPPPVRTRCRNGRVTDLGVNRWSRATRYASRRRRVSKSPRIGGRGRSGATFRPSKQVDSGFESRAGFQGRSGATFRSKQVSLRHRLRSRRLPPVKKRYTPKRGHNPPRLADFAVCAPRGHYPGRCSTKSAAFSRHRKPVTAFPRRRKPVQCCPVAVKAEPCSSANVNKMTEWARENVAVRNMPMFRNPWLPTKPVTIRRNPHAPPMTALRARELDFLIYGSNIPIDRPPYEQISVKKASVLGPTRHLCLPQYTEEEEKKILGVMFGFQGVASVNQPRAHAMHLGLGSSDEESISSKSSQSDFSCSNSMPPLDHRHDSSSSDEDESIMDMSMGDEEEPSVGSSFVCEQLVQEEIERHRAAEGARLARRAQVNHAARIQRLQYSQEIEELRNRLRWPTFEVEEEDESSHGLTAAEAWRERRNQKAVRVLDEQMARRKLKLKELGYDSQDDYDLFGPSDDDEDVSMVPYPVDVSTWTQPKEECTDPLLGLSVSVPQDHEPMSDGEDEYLFPVIWDSGASVCITYDKDDFVSFSPRSSLSSLSGFAAGSGQKVQGEGMVAWDFCDLRGNIRTVYLKAYYVPKAKVRLLSTQTFLDTYHEETVAVTKEGATISGVHGDPEAGPLFAPRNKASNLIISMGSHPSRGLSNVNSINSISLYPESCSLASPVPAVARENINLSGAEKELLSWHERLGHIAFAKIQHLMKSGVLATSEAARRLQRSASLLQPLKCAACIFAKQRQRARPGQTTKVNQARSGILRKNNLLPGQEVSVDHFLCSNKGRLFTSRGKTADKQMYAGGCIFVDHASSYIHIELQKTLSSHNTIQAKNAYEDHCRDHGIVPQKYLSDNGSSFKSREFTAHLEQFKQVTRFAGVGAHHHNGHAERGIQTIMSIARAMMIHAAIRWPDMADTSLWPMAVQHAVFLWNHVPSPTHGLSPADIFTRKTFPHAKFQDMHVWGCPVYALEKKLHDGNKLPRWAPRSKRCVYLGGAPSYATSVPLVLNPETGTITPQFHVVFDDGFHTVSADMSKFPDLNSDEWNKLFGDSALQYMPDENEIELQTSMEHELEGATDAAHADEARSKVLEAAENARPSIPLEKPLLNPPAWREKISPESSVPSATSERAQPMDIPQPQVTSQTSVTPKTTQVSSESKPPPSPISTKEPVEAKSRKPVLELPKPASVTSPTPSATPRVEPKVSESVPKTRLKRKEPEEPVKRQSRRLQGISAEPRRSRRLRGQNAPMEKGLFTITTPFTHYAQTLKSLKSPTSMPTGDSNQFEIDGQPLQDASVYPSLWTAQKKDPDIFTYDEAMRDPDREKFLEGAQQEIDELESYKAWEEVPRCEADHVVPTTWVFRRKRRPDGTIKRWKARFCIRGDLMQGIHDTFAPVVAFSTVRVFLIMSLILNWYTCSIDFSNAFIQAFRNKPVYMQPPRGFKTKGPNMVLKLIRSLYGAKDAPKLWTKLLFKAIRELGFTQSTFDPCLWYKKDIFIVIFVDDCGIASRTEAIADEFIAAMKKKGFKLTKEESFAEFLGIQYHPLQNGDIHLTQKGLITKILEAMGLENASTNKVPAAREPLGIDPDGPPMTETWNYPSIVGMLLYLTTNTRPDIAYAVSQVARFTHAPKQTHAVAVKMIARYLKGTLDKGTIVKKVTKLTLTAFCDADFAGLFKRDPDSESSSAKSRSGYIIKLSECPLLAKSFLQPTIALSTAESEYYALSQCMRVLLPLRGLIEEFIKNVDIPKHLRPLDNRIHATCHEDNSSCLSLATDQKLTSRTRHYHVRWHFFWHHVNKGDVKVVYVETKNQDADYLTKALPVEPFCQNRVRVQGW